MGTPGTPLRFRQRVEARVTPVRYYQLGDVVSGAVAPNSATGFPDPHDWDGTISGTVDYQQAAFNTAVGLSMGFNSNDGIEVTAGGVVAGPLSFTVWAWCQTTSTGEMIIVQQRDAAGFLGEWVMQTHPSSVGKLYAWGYATDAAYEFSMVSTTSINDGNPHLVGFTLDQVTTTAYLYVDGVLEVTDTTPNGSSFNGSLNLCIARDFRDANRTWQGRLSDVGLALDAMDAAGWDYAYNG